jgi:hypothetical protein
MYFDYLTNSSGALPIPVKSNEVCQTEKFLSLGTYYKYELGEPLWLSGKVVKMRK